tara:strand:- start:1717 stop:2646 length:930 start_codon:yes stop_codon:yes gene_type:complete
MSFDVSSLTNYVDEQAMSLIVQSVAGGQLSKYAQIQPGVKGPTTINILDTDVSLQDDACSRSADGTTTLSQRTITPNALAVHEDLCMSDLASKYTQTMLQQGVTNEKEEIPFAELYFALKIAKIQKQLEIKDWTGTAGAGSYAGLGTQASSVVDVASPTAGIQTASIIIESLSFLAQSMDEDITDADDIKIFLGMDLFLMYQRAIADGNYFHYVVDGQPGNELPLIGFPQVTVVGTVGLSGLNSAVVGDVVAYLTRASNIVIGVDLPDEEANDYRAWYDPNDRIFKTSFAFRRGINWAFPTEACKLKIS